jgi:hypothetical protein
MILKNAIIKKIKMRKIMATMAELRIIIIIIVIRIKAMLARIIKMSIGTVESQKTNRMSFH